MKFDSRWCFLMRTKFEEERKRLERAGHPMDEAKIEAFNDKMSAYEADAWKFDQMTHKQDDSVKQLASMISSMLRNQAPAQPEAPEELEAAQAEKPATGTKGTKKSA